MFSIIFLKESVFLSFLLIGIGVLGEKFDDDDAAVIIDAEINVAVKPRGGSRQFGFLPSWPERVGVMEEKMGFSPIMTCTTGDGKEGKCVPFEECFPLRHIVSDAESNLLNEEIRRGMEHKNCSAVVHAGTSNYRNICCPTIPHTHAYHKPPTPPGMSVPVQDSSDLLRASSPSSCGRSQTASTKIVNGTNTIPGEFPWMVVMFGKSGKQTCGGSLISSNMVLTAAHCIHNYVATDVSKIRLFIGDYNIRSNTDGSHEVRGVKRLIKHKYFNIQSFVNDIALLRLDRPVLFSNRIQPICLPPETRSNLVNKKLIVAGWGRVSYGGPTSPILQKVNVRVWPNSNCASVYKGIAPGGILSTMICAGDKGLDSCVGDSGGPLMHKTDTGIFEQTGIVSFGKGCGTHPGVYTRVGEFLPWIASNINK